MLLLPAAAVLGAVVVFAEVHYVLSVYPRLHPERTRLCDREVAILLDSRDAIDLQRAGILIRELDCNVSRRLVGRVP